MDSLHLQYEDKRAKIWIMGLLKTGDHIQTKIKMPNPSQGLLASSKAPNDDLRDMDILCTFKIKIVSQNLDLGVIKDQWPYPNQDQDPKPRTGTPESPDTRNQDLKDMMCILSTK